MDDKNIAVIDSTGLLEVTESFRRTIALMYRALLNAEPIISRQLEVIETFRTLGNVLLFVCFLTIMFVLFQTHKEAQGVKKYSDIKLKKRWLAVMICVFVVSLGIFNIYPGLALTRLDRAVTSEEAAEEAERRLFMSVMPEEYQVVEEVSK